MLMPLHLLFWLNLYHVITRNTAKNLASVTGMGKIALTCVNVSSSVKTQTLHYPEQHLKRIFNLKRDLVNVQ